MKFKALFFAFTMFLMCLPTNTIYAQSIPKVAEYILTEDFENATENEDGSYSYGGTNTLKSITANGYKSYSIDTDDENFCLKYIPENGKQSRITFKIPESVTEGIAIIEADVKFRSDSQPMEFKIAGSGDATYSAFQFLSSGKIRETKSYSKTPAEHNLGEYNRVRLICDIDNSKYYVQINGKDVNAADLYNDRHSFSEVSGLAFWFGTLGAAATTTGEVCIDNIKVYKANSLFSFVVTPENQQSDVKVTDGIRIDFSQKMDESTLVKENFIIKNIINDDSIAFSVKGKQDSYIVLTSSEFSSDNSYTVSSTASLLTAKNEAFETKFTEFSTLPTEITDSCTLTNPVFSSDIASVNITNNSDEEVTATVIAALYEKLSDGNENFKDFKHQTITIDAGSSETYSSNAFNTEEAKEYAVRFFLWDSVAGKSPLAKSVAVNAEKLEEDKLYKTDRAVVSVKETDVDRAYVSFVCDFDSNYSKRLAYVIEDPNGKICNMGQISSCEADILEASTRFSKGTPSGTYTIKYKADGVVDELECPFTLDMTQAKPTAVNVRVEGEGIAEETIEGKYEYFHIGNIAESESSFVWYVSDTENGEYSAIEGENKKTLLVSDFLTLKYVKFGVTAKTESVTGSETLSEPIKIYARPMVSDVKISGEVKVGNTVSASYKTYHPEGVEIDVICRWLLVSGDTYSEISTGKSFEINQSAGQKIVLEITPTTNVYPETGKSVFSNEYTVCAAVKEQGRPSSGGGGGVSRPVVEDKKEPQEDKEEASYKNFSDVPESHWAYENIKTLSAKNIIKGKGEGNFAPEETVTRAEFVTMIVRALNLEQSGEVEFSDVNEEDWYYSAIKAAASLKIVSGHDGSFRPLAPITREEMAVIISNACSLSETEENTVKEVTFTDASEISSWAKESIAKMVDAKILTGFDDGSFRGQSFSTRAQSAAVICRLLGL